MTIRDELHDVHSARASTATTNTIDHATVQTPESWVPAGGWGALDPAPRPPREPLPAIGHAGHVAPLTDTAVGQKVALEYARGQYDQARREAPVVIDLQAQLAVERALRSQAEAQLDEEPEPVIAIGGDPAQQAQLLRGAGMCLGACAGGVIGWRACDKLPDRLVAMPLGALAGAGIVWFFAAFFGGRLDLGGLISVAGAASPTVGAVTSAVASSGRRKLRRKRSVRQLRSRIRL